MPRITLATLMILLMCGLATGQHPVSGPPSREGAPAEAGSLAPQPSQARVRRTLQQAEQRGRANESGPIPIPPPQAGMRRGAASPAPATTAGNVATVVLSSLAIVLGLFFFVVWLSRRALPKSSATLSKDVLELLGRAPLASRHHLQLIRFGRRLLLISVTPDRAETLTEITDPDELNHLTSLCRQQQPGSISDSFRQVLHQLGASPGTAGSAARAGLDDSGLATTGARRRG